MNALNTAFKLAVAEPDEGLAAYAIAAGADVHAVVGVNTPAGKVADAIFAQQSKLGPKDTAKLVAKAIIALK